jgi:hypothetical protein
MNCVHLVPHGGIANRVRAIVSALWMTERLDTELFVTWRPGRFLQASWEDLYEGSLPSPPPGLDERDTLLLEDPTFIDPTDPAVRATDVLELSTCHAFSFRPEIRALSYRFWAAVRPFLLRLTPSPEVRALADRVARRFGPDVLGAHLRTGGGAIQFTTPNRAAREVFFTEIDRIREETPRMQVYLASDSPDDVAAARARYGTDLIAMDDHVDWDFRTTDSADDGKVALAELILLSRTQKLLGTYFSSFAVLAGAMGALPYKELCKPEKDPRWRQFEREPFEAGD